MKGITVLAGMLVLCCLFIRGSSRTEQDLSGVPDALSSVVSGRTCILTVAANTDHIEDKEMFAREIIRMCRENSFRSLRLSTDIGGWPEKLDITVYYHREDIGREEPVMRIVYEPVDDAEKISIADENPEKYMLNIE